MDTAVKGRQSLAHFQLYLQEILFHIQTNKALVDCPALGIEASGGVIREVLHELSRNDVIQGGSLERGELHFTSISYLNI